MGSTAITTAKMGGSATSPTLRIIDVGQIMSSDLGGRLAVDARLISPNSALLTNNIGDLYESRYVDGRIKT
jgi:hypothetical protein